MKTIQSLMLAAIVLGTSACASNAVKQQPVTELNAAPPTSGTLAAPVAAVPASPTAIAPEAITQAEPDAEALHARPPVLDPWEGFNRNMHGFNNVLDRFVFRPVAVGYDKIVPDPVQSGVSRFFSNLRLPVTAVNQALQGRPGQAGQSLGRFVVNSTAGIAGVFDPAAHIGLPKRDGEDFGQTLATWGWSDSRYLVLPLLGPRTVRDTVAIVGDQPLSPIGHIEKSGIADKLQIVQMVDGRAQMLPLDKFRKDALDDYTFVRDAWAQRRNRQIEQDLSRNRD